jgi:alanine racemase
MPEAPPPTLRLHLDNEALAANWRTLDRLSGAARAGAAVKADAYGLRVARAVPVLREAGCADWFVAHWNEVADLAALVPPEQIAVLHGPIRPEDCTYARALGVRPVINSVLHARLWLESGGGPCDLMVDTGINRLGLPMSAIGEELIARLEVVTVMSHLACADEDHPLNATQLARASEVFAAIPARRRSLANSAGIGLGADYAFDLTRPGISLYGGVQRPEFTNEIRQVATPQAAILQVRELQAGDTVGYNATFTATAPMRVGVVSLGYADGYLRAWSGKGALRHGEAMLPLLGKVSMDLTVVDLNAAPQLKEGDWLDVPYGLPEASAVSGLSQYELLTALGHRFRR